MGETEDHFVHNPVRSDRTRNWDRTRVPRIDVQKVVLVEIVELVISDTASHRRNTVDVRLRHHRLHVRLHIPIDELTFQMAVTKRGQIKLWAHTSPHPPERAPNCHTPPQPCSSQ